MSLSNYLLAEIKDIAAQPTLLELRERLHQRERGSALLDTARLIRNERRTREERDAR
jgi:hypothetical protein